MSPLQLYSELHHRGRKAVIIVPGQHLMWAGTSDVDDLEPQMAEHYRAMECLAQEFAAPKLGVGWSPELVLNAANRILHKSSSATPP